MQFLTTFFGAQNNMEESLIVKTYEECSQDREQTFNKLCKLTYSVASSSAQAETPSSKRKRKRTDLENEPMSDVSAPVSQLCTPVKVQPPVDLSPAADLKQQISVQLITELLKCKEQEDGYNLV